MDDDHIQDLKLWLIHEIAETEDRPLLEDLKTRVTTRKKRYLYEPEGAESDLLLKQIVMEPDAFYRPFDLDLVIAKQGWKPVDRTEWDRLVEELDIQEPVEELLALLTQ